MANAIDEIANAIGVTRGAKDDAALALTVLQTLHRLWKKANPPGWVYDREENTYTLDAGGTMAYVSRSRSLKAWVYFVSVGKKTVCEGQTNSAETALEICSLAVS